MKKQEEQTLKKRDKWRLLYLGIPVAFGPVLAKNLGLEYGAQILASGMISGLAACLGIFCYNRIKEKTNIVKGGGLLAISVLIIGVGMFFSKKLTTCAVCGYKTILVEGETCKICGIPMTQEYIEEQGFLDFNEMIEEEQLWFFSGEEGFTFYEPKVYVRGMEEFNKDSNWSPKIKEEDIEEAKKRIEELAKSIK